MESPHPFRNVPVLVPLCRSMLCPQLVMTGSVGVCISEMQWTVVSASAAGEKEPGLRV